MSSSGDRNDVEYRTACLRLPDFPLQWLYHKRPKWRGRKVAWLEQLKPDSPLRYLSAEAEAMGLAAGMRYATALGLVPDLLAGTCDAEALALTEKGILKGLRRFTPVIRRGSAHLANGLYRLDAKGLGPAFGGMRSWAEKLLKSLREMGWEAVLTLGFTPFACEMASYKLTSQRPLRMFTNRQQEQEQTMRMPLSLFGLSPDQVLRLQRLGVLVLEDFLAFDADEVRRRFGPDLVEFYAKAGEALFVEFAPLPEEEPLWAQFGLPEPTVCQQGLLEISRHLLGQLLPRLIKKEEGVSQLLVWLITEEGTRVEHRLVPSYPTVDAHWLDQLLRLRLESYFQKHPLRWGNRVERVVMALLGEPDPEKQGELFAHWSLVENCGEKEHLLPRDRDAAVGALSRVRAQYGEGCLRRARLVDHPLPGRDYAWTAERENQDWFKGKNSGSASSMDLRIRRQLAHPLALSSQDRWQDKDGPFFFDGGWWEAAPFVRQYFFAHEGAQTGWIYWDQRHDCWFVQGWLQ